MGGTQQATTLTTEKWIDFRDVTSVYPATSYTITIVRTGHHHSSLVIVSPLPEDLGSFVETSSFELQYYVDFFPPSRIPSCLLGFVTIRTFSMQLRTQLRLDHGTLEEYGTYCLAFATEHHAATE
jgi:hypothetical protein